MVAPSPNEFRWSASIENRRTAPSTAPNSAKLLISGTLVDKSVNGNKWSLSDKCMKSVAEQANTGRIRLRLDHSRDVEKVVGRIMSAKNEGEKISFEGSIIAANDNLMAILGAGLVDHVSISGDARTILCSSDNKSLDGHPLCKDAHMVVDDMKLVEASLVVEPAYESASFEAVGFSAALTENLDKRMMKMGEEADKAKAQAQTTDATADALKAIMAKITEMEKRLPVKAEEEEEEEEEEASTTEEEDAKKKKEEEAAAKKGGAKKKAKADLEKVGKNGEPAGGAPPMEQPASENPFIANGKPNTMLMTACLVEDIKKKAGWE